MTTLKVDIAGDLPDDFVTEDEMARVLFLIIANLRTIREFRIRDGKTADGRPMLTGGGQFGTTARYSKEYEEFKKKKGRSPYTPGDRLVLTNLMLASQSTEVRGNIARLFFGTTEQKKALGNELRRPFIGFSDAEVDQAIKDALAEFRRG